MSQPIKKIKKSVMEEYDLEMAYWLRENQPKDMVEEEDWVFDNYSQAPSEEDYFSILEDLAEAEKAKKAEKALEDLAKAEKPKKETEKKK